MRKISFCYYSIAATVFALNCTGNSELELAKKNPPPEVLAAIANEKIDHAWPKQVIVGIKNSAGSLQTINNALARDALAKACSTKLNSTAGAAGISQSATVVCADAESRELAEEVLRDASANLIVAPDLEISVQNYGLRVTDEPLSANQWALTTLGIQEAWDKLSVRTTRTIVAVIDSGVDPSHPEFAGKLTSGYDFVADSQNQQDTNGHGTHVAGIIAAHANRAGVAGVGPNVYIMPLKIIAQDGKGSVSNLLKALRYAVDHGAHVINISAAFYATAEYQQEYLDILGAYVRYAESRGVLVVASQGNRRLNAGEMVFPAQVPGVISVGATNPAGSHLIDYGISAPLVFAPGVNILSARCSFLHSSGYTVPCPGVSPWNERGYSYATGTSASAAYVSGTAALLKGEKNTLTAAEVRDFITHSAANQNLNTAQAVSLLLAQTGTPASPNPDAPPPAPSAPPEAVVVGQTENYDFLGSCAYSAPVGGRSCWDRTWWSEEAQHNFDDYCRLILFGQAMSFDPDGLGRLNGISGQGCFALKITGNPLLDAALRARDLARALAILVLSSQSLTAQDLVNVGNYMSQILNIANTVTNGADRAENLRALATGLVDGIVQQNYAGLLAVDRQKLQDDILNAALYEISVREGNPVICGGCAGNPVHLANGIKELSVTDLKISNQKNDMVLRRRHNVQLKNNFSVGRGWFFNHDTRVMLGVKKDAAKLYSQALSLYNQAQAAILQAQSADQQIAGYLSELGSIQNQSGSAAAQINGLFTSAEQSRQHALSEKNAAASNASQAVAQGNEAIAKATEYAVEPDKTNIINHANDSKNLALSNRDAAQANYDAIVAAIGNTANQVSGISNLAAAIDEKIAIIQQKKNQTAAIVADLVAFRDHLFPLVDQLRSDSEIAAQLMVRNRDAIDPANPDEQFFGTGFIKWIDETGTNRVFILHGDGTATPYDNARNAIQNRVTLMQNADLTYTVRTIEGLVYQFGADGLIRSKGDLSGNTLNYHYTVKEDIEGDGNPKLRLSYIEDTYGRKTSFIYEANLLRQVLDPIGRTVKYSYVNGMLDKVSDPAEQQTAYSYGEAGSASELGLTHIVDRNGAERSYEYTAIDNLARVTREIDPLGNTWRFAYDFANHTTDVTNRRGFTTRYVNNARGSTVQKIFADGSVETSEYDTRQNLTKKTDAGGNSTFIEYNADNLPVKITHADGAVQYLSYDSNGRVIQATDATGAITRIYRDTAGNPVEIQTPAGTIRQIFDNQGRLLSTTDGNGRITTYTYDTYGYLKTIRNPEGGMTYLTFDQVGRLLSKREHDGATSFIEYDVLDRPVRIVNALGEATFFAYLPEGQLRQKIEPGNRITTFAYDAAGQLISVIEPGDTRTNISYDENGNVRARIRNGSLSTSMVYDNRDRLLFSNTDSRITRFTYNATGRITSTVDPLGGTTTFAYDARYRMTSTTDALNGVSRFEYDAEGRISAMVDQLGHRTVYNRDTAGRVTMITDALGNRMTATYDANGNVTSHRNARGALTSISYNGLGQPSVKTDALGGRTRYEYDPQGRLRVLTDANSAVTVLDYDLLSRVVRRTNAEGEVERSEYDERGNIAAMIDGTGARSSLVYDTRNRLIRVVDALGAVTSFEYDKFDRRTAVINAENERTEFTYDKIGNLKSTLLPGGFETTYRHDKLSRLTDKYDALGRQTQYRYDAISRLTEVVDAMGAVTRYNYDAAGNLKRTTDANGNSTDYAYDALNRLVEERNALNQSNLFNYDAAGNLARKTNADYSTIDYRYDLLDRPTERQYYDPSAAGAGLRTDTFVFDAVGNLVLQKNPDAEEAYEYDRVRRVTRVNNLTLGRSFEYGYDLAGRMTRIGNPRGAGANLYTYDPAGRLVQSIAADSDGRPNNFSYDKVGRLRQRELANGTTANYQYDLSGRLTRLTDAMAGSALVAMDFQYDAAGNITSIAREGGRSEAMSYDNNDRLVSYARTSAALGTRRAEYTYDAVGNRVREFGSIVTGNGDVSNTYNQLNQLTRRQSLTEGTSTPLSASVTQYEYDARGNRVLENAAGQLTRFSYSLENQLTKIKQASGDEYSYRYDAVGRRVYKGFKKFRAELANGGVGINEAPLEATHMLYDRRQVLFDTHDDRTAKALYHYLPQTDFPYGSLISMKSYEAPGVTGSLAATSGETLFYHTDHLATTQKLTDRTGAVRVNYDHDAWGVALSRSGDERSVTPVGAPQPISLEPVNRYTYTGKEHEFGTQLTHMDARAYHAKTAQFKQRDPLNLASSQLTSPAILYSGLATASVSNLQAQPKMTLGYSYVSNNPLVYSDPTGLVSTPMTDEGRYGTNQHGALTYNGASSNAGLFLMGSGMPVSSDSCFSYLMYPFLDDAGRITGGMLYDSGYVKTFVQNGITQTYIWTGLEWNPAQNPQSQFDIWALERSSEFYRTAWGIALPAVAFGGVALATASAGSLAYLFSILNSYVETAWGSILTRLGIRSVATAGSVGGGSVWLLPRGVEIVKNYQSPVGKGVQILESATKHIVEMLLRNQASMSASPLNRQLIQESLYRAIDKALFQGLRFGEKMYIDGWELMFSIARNGGDPVLFHAIQR